MCRIQGLVFVAVGLLASGADAGIVTKILGEDLDNCDITLAAMSSDGSTIAFVDCIPSTGQSSLNPKLYRVRTDGSGLQKVATLPKDRMAWLRVSADGSKFAFIFGKTFEGQWSYTDAYFVDSADGVVKCLTGLEIQDQIVEPVDLTADGSMIIFSRWHAQLAKYGLFRMNTDGTGEQKIFDKPGECSVSGDGSTVAVSAWVGNEVRVFVLRSDGTDVREIPTPEQRDKNPTLNHDGSRVTFVSHNDGEDTAKVYVAATDGSSVTMVKTDVGGSTISGDGLWLAYGATPDWSVWDLWRSRVDGTTAQFLAPCGFAVTMERQLSSDGSRLAWQCNYGGPKGLFLGDWNLPNVKMTGPAKPGKIVTLNVNGGADDPTLVFLAPQQTSLPLPPYGVLGVDASTMVVLVSTALDGTGTLSFGGAIPNEPSLVGAHAYIQAISGPAPLVATGKLTNTLDLEILP